MGTPIFELPATFEMIVWFKDDEHGQIGKVTLSLPVGKYPTKEKIAEMVDKAKEELSETALEICSPHEFGRAVLMEKTGQRVAVPGPNEWAEPYSG